jgi:hypothetical protein
MLPNILAVQRDGPCRPVLNLGEYAHMDYLAKFFWPLLPVVFLFLMVREGGTEVQKYVTMALNPATAFETYKDLQGIATIVSIHYQTAHALPSDLPAFLQETRVQRMGRDRGKHEDAWGNPYQLRDMGEYFYVLSCGPSGDCNVEHDNLSERVRKIKKSRYSDEADRLRGL